FEALSSAAVADARAGELDAAILSAAKKRSWAELAPFDGEVLTELLLKLETAQPFGESHRVGRTPDLFEPAGGRLSRLIRAGRRFRRAIAGPGFRTVPIGRLWRYHVSLEVPVVLWSHTEPAEAELWHALLHHYRTTRAQLGAVIDGTWASDNLGIKEETDTATE